MGRVLGLDVGEKTIGVAWSDEAQIIAFPGNTILRQEGYKRDMATLRQLIAEKEVSEIVVGMPLMLDGSRGVQAHKMEEFIARLRGSVRIPISTQDERLSTAEAEKVLLATDRRREQHKETIDSLAACLLLQTYLDRKQAKL